MPVQRSGSSKNPARTWVTTATTGAESIGLNQESQAVGKNLLA